MSDNPAVPASRNLVWYIRTIAAGVANEARNGFTPPPEEPGASGVMPGRLPSQDFQVSSVLLFREASGEDGDLPGERGAPVCLPATDRTGARFAAAVASANRDAATRGRYVVMLSSGAVAETGAVEWDPGTGVAVVHAPSGLVGYSADDLAGVPRQG